MIIFKQANVLEFYKYLYILKMTISRNTYVAATSRCADRRNGLRQKCFAIPRANSFNRYILQIIILHRHISILAYQLLNAIKRIEKTAFKNNINLFNTI